MKIALAQMDVIPGKPELNIANMAKWIEKAKAEKADIISFPEMCIGGYLLGDNWLNDNYCRNLMSYNKDIIDMSENIVIIWGNIYLDDTIEQRSKGDHLFGKKAYHPNKDGRIRRYNAAYICQNKQLCTRYSTNYACKDIQNILPQGIKIKTLLPNYRFFDDERYFFSALDFHKDFIGLPFEISPLNSPFEITINGKDHLIGLELCEDLWCEDYRMNHNCINPTKYAIQNGAELIINISASPWTYGKHNARDKRVKFIYEDCINSFAKENTCKQNSFVPFAYVNCVGVQNNGKNFITFDGGSTVYNQNGDRVLITNEAYKEKLLTFKTEDIQNMKVVERELGDKIEQKAEAIIRALQTFDCSITIGLSGGIDSAVSAGLSVLALGSDKVKAVNMPTKYNSLATKDAAKDIACALGIEYKIINIQTLVDANIEALKQSGIEIPPIVLENIQAKIRGTPILSNFAQMNKGIFTNNGNKLEIFLGYATLYGDVGGGISVIGDLTKIEVIQMAKYLNKKFNKTIIPDKLLPDELFRFKNDQIKPSAELESNQIDPMKFGYQDALMEAYLDFKKKSPEDIMQWWLDGTLAQNLGINPEFIDRWGLQDARVFIDDLKWFTSKFTQQVFKRVQSPPIIVTSKTAFGFDLRESILPWNGFSREGKILETKILKQGVYKKIQ